MKQIKGEILIENYTWDMFHHAPLSIRQEDCKHNQPPLNPKPSNACELYYDIPSTQHHHRNTTKTTMANEMYQIIKV